MTTFVRNHNLLWLNLKWFFGNKYLDSCINEKHSKNIIHAWSKLQNYKLVDRFSSLYAHGPAQGPVSKFYGFSGPALVTFNPIFFLQHHHLCILSSKLSNEDICSLANQLYNFLVPFKRDVPPTILSIFVL